MPREWPRPGPTRWSSRSWGWRRATATGRGAPSRKKKAVVAATAATMTAHNSSAPPTTTSLATGTARCVPGANGDQDRDTEGWPRSAADWLQVQRPPPRRRAQEDAKAEARATPPAATLLAGDEPTGTEVRRRHLLPLLPRGAWPSRRSRRETSPGDRASPAACQYSSDGMASRLARRRQATSAHPPPSGYHTVRRTAAGAGDDHLKRPRAAAKGNGDALIERFTRTSSVRSTVMVFAAIPAPVRSPMALSPCRMSLEIEGSPQPLDPDVPPERPLPSGYGRNGG